MSMLRFAARSSILPRMAFNASLQTRQTLLPRYYSAAAGLSRSDIELRVLDVLKGFEKVDPAKLTTTASFEKDLGLDSLDAVEVVMAVEEEFMIEIPDEEADNIQTVDQGLYFKQLITALTHVSIIQLLTTLPKLPKPTKIPTEISAIEFDLPHQSRP
ncbi:hypothetical protein EV360DRAFT_84085 [Lentinula raphanica]|nr:hypothetical protein EV360DRAFT_84085 [Lentinula raphanica]